MPRKSPYDIRLSSTELTQLERRAGKYTLPYFQVQRAKMILLAAQGLTNDQIAARLDTRREMVSRLSARATSSGSFLDGGLRLPLTSPIVWRVPDRQRRR